MNTEPVLLEKGVMSGINMTPKLFWESYFKKTPLRFIFNTDDNGKEKDYSNCIISEMNEPIGGVANVIIVFREYGSRHCDDPIKWKGCFDFNTNVGYPTSMDRWPSFFED
jgi:hypothetical protein